MHDAEQSRGRPHVRKSAQLAKSEDKILAYGRAVVRYNQDQNFKDLSYNIYWGPIVQKEHTTF